MPIKIIRQDITKLTCDAIVSPTDCYMCPDGGADGAIHAAAGPQLATACADIAPISVGEAVITAAFDLPCKYVIHTVGPKWQGGLCGEAVLLRSCYNECLRLAVSHGCRSIAFPLIASGRYGYPKDRVLKEATHVIGSFLEEHELDVYVTVYDKESYSISTELFDEVAAYVDDNYVGVRMDGRSTDFQFCRRMPPAPKSVEPQTECEYSEPHGEMCECAEPRIRASIEPRASADRKPCGIMSEAMPPREYGAKNRSDNDDTVGSYYGSRRLKHMLENMDKGFTDTLLYYIDKKGLTDVEAYKRSNISRKTFSKIRCTKDYRPSKVTAVSFAIGLRLNLEETEHLLKTAGMCLSKSYKFDLIIEYFIMSGKYENVFDVNAVLYKMDQPLLGV